MGTLAEPFKMVPIIDKRKIRAISKAIRKNGVPQVIGTYKRYKGNDIVGACAIGQAAINMKKPPETVRQQLSFAYSSTVDCPVKNKFHFYTETLGQMVIHLNDNHSWKLDRIADYLDKLAA